jgi:hypothetical protein
MRVNGMTSTGSWLNANGTTGVSGDEQSAVNSSSLTIGRRTLIDQNPYLGNLDEVIIYTKQLDIEFMDNAFSASSPN